MNIDKPKYCYKGINNPNTKIKDESTIHAVCHTLQHKPELPLPVVARLHKLKPEMVRMIYKQRTWKHISTTYDFTLRCQFGAKFNYLRQQKEITSNEMVGISDTQCRSFTNDKKTIDT